MTPDQKLPKNKEAWREIVTPNHFIGIGIEQSLTGMFFENTSCWREAMKRWFCKSSSWFANPSIVRGSSVVWPGLDPLGAFPSCASIVVVIAANGNVYRNIEWCIHSDLCQCWEAPILQAALKIYFLGYINHYSSLSRFYFVSDMQVSMLNSL